MVMKHILLFEKFTEEPEVKPLSKRELKRLKYSKVLTNKILTTDELDNYDIPSEIKKIMSTWEVINKSPYSDSFYNTVDVGWDHKPDGSYRVSDHWNFYTREKWHCETDKKVQNNTHISLGKYNKETGKYEVILTLPTNKQVEKVTQNEIKLKHLKDPETIWKKKQFKDKITNKEVMINLSYNGKEYKGIVGKYTGSELRIEDLNGDQIFVENDMKTSKTKYLIFTDKQGNKIEDPIQWDGK